jgi:hypothetical protein
VNEYKITAYHEAAHIVTNAMTGKCVSRCIIRNHEGFTDYFLDTTIPILPSYTVSGIPHFPQKEEKPLSSEELEAQKLAFYRTQNLEHKLMTLAAGVEAALKYAKENNWDITQLSEEAMNQDMRDVQDTNTYIHAHGRQSEHDILIHKASIDARKVLQIEQVWSDTCAFAELLIEERSFRWETLLEKYKQIIKRCLNTPVHL